MAQILARERLGTDPVGKLMFRMAVPSVIAMLMQALYNTVDSAFAARVSNTGLVAVTLAFPIQMIAGAMSTGIGVGINSSISRGLGSGDESKPGKAAANGMMIGLISVLIMVLFGLFGAGWFIRMYSTEETVISTGITYIRTISILSFGNIFTQISFSILQGSGSMIIPLVCHTAGAVSLFIFDWLFSSVFHMGILGIALGSSCAQIVSMCIGLFGVFVKNRQNLPISAGDFKPDGEVIKDILSVGIPSALTQATTSVVSGILNKIIARYGSAAVSVYGGYAKFSTFGILPVFGVTRGMNPVLGFSYGAKNRERFLKARRIAATAALIITSLTGVLFLLMPQLVLRLYNATPEMMEIGPAAYRIMGLSLFINGVSIVLSQSFPPAKRSYLTMIYTMTRQVGLLVPLCLLIPRIWGMTGVWIGYALTDYLAFFIVLVMDILFRKKVLGTWKEEEK